jgi:hypothetical protein
VISTRHLGGLPHIPTFRRLTRSLAALDAILSPAWEHRYYSLNAQWAPGELMASMRNGQGDQWFALIDQHGIIVHGLDHESPMYRPDNPWPGVLDAVPQEFAPFADEYYGVTVPPDAVTAIYRHEPLTESLVTRLNPTLGVSDLASDLAEIGYPESS